MWRVGCGVQQVSLPRDCFSPQTVAVLHGCRLAREQGPAGRAHALDTLVQLIQEGKLESGRGAWLEGQAVV